MRILSFFVATVLFLSSVSVQARGHRQLTREWKKVVRLTAYAPDGMRGVTASGFPVDNDSFLTAGHFCASVADGVEAGALKEEINITYINQNNEIVTMGGGEIVRYELSLTQDLCLVVKEKHGIPPVTLLFGYNLKFGDKVFAVGAPLAFFPIVTEGFVSQPIVDDTLIEELYGKLTMSVPVAPGNSGGPVFNLKGEVVGVVVMVHPMYPHISVAVNAIDIWRFMLGG